MGYKLRDYQQAASDAAVAFFRSKERKNSLIVISTGGGKSLIIANVARQLDGNILVLQPSKEILQQNYDKLCSYGVECSIYSASLNKKDISRITFATIGSIINHKDDFAQFKAIIVDEAHNINAQDGMYKDFFDHVPRKILGLTATPYRLYAQQGIEAGGKFMPNGTFKTEDYFYDEYHPKRGVMLVNRCIEKFLTRTRPRIFKDVIYEVSTQKLLADGFLARLRYFPIQLIDASRVRRNSTGMDYDEQSLNAEFDRCSLNTKLIDIVQRLLHPKRGGERKGILVFTKFIAESEALCKAIPNCEILTGGTKKKDRERIIADFKAGRVKVLTNVGVLTTGFDYPELDTVVMARPTMSLSLWYQAVGRAIRPCAGKQPWIIDLGGNLERFGEVENFHLTEEKPGEYAIMGYVQGQWKYLTNIYY